MGKDRNCANCADCCGVLSQPNMSDLLNFESCGGAAL